MITIKEIQEYLKLRATLRKGYGQLNQSIYGLALETRRLRNELVLISEDDPLNKSCITVTKKQFEGVAGRISNNADSYIFIKDYCPKFSPKYAEVKCDKTNCPAWQKNWEYTEKNDRYNAAKELARDFKRNMKETLKNEWRNLGK